MRKGCEGWVGDGVGVGGDEGWDGRGWVRDAVGVDGDEGWRGGGETAW